MKAQILLEVELTEAGAGDLVLTRMYDMVVGSCSSSKPLYRGQQLKGMMVALVGALTSFVQESQVKKSGNPGFADSMNHFADGASIALDCGHPNVQPGQTCPLCGKSI